MLLVAVAVAAGLGYHAATLERHEIDDRRALVATIADARALQAALSDARRALAAMASPGQPAVSWSRQAGAALDTARARLASLATGPAGADVAKTTERLERLVETEGRLRDYAVGGRSLMASDVAFGEALPHIDAIDVTVADAAATITAAAEQDMAETRRQQAMALAGALGTLALAALILAPTPPAQPSESVPQPAAPDEHAGELSLDLGLATPQAAMSSDSARTSASATARSSVQAVDLSPVAAVCAELARLSDGAALSSALERVAPAIGAKGLVVWLVDADRKALQAAASWGYDPRVVERFPTVPVLDDNPTSQAFSAGTPSIAAGRAGQPAAVATPIIGSNGTVGVLALELTSSGTPHAEVVAVAGILAAQLASLLEPLPRGETPASDATRARQG